MHIRPAQLSDRDTMVELLVQDAHQRRALDPTLWKLAPDACAQIASLISSAMEAGIPPFRQQWLLAQADGEIVGITHSIILPVPPIYAGELGVPGLIMEDCFVSDNAPANTRAELLTAAEADLIGAGAKILLASSVVGGAWEADISAQGYAPLTLYFAKVGLSPAPRINGVRHTTDDDLDAIVALSATNRQVLNDLNGLFWKPHRQADARFELWMARSLTLADRDMFVAEHNGTLAGYAIAQPATSLHFPAAHAVSDIGFIDDYFHTGYADPVAGVATDPAAMALLEAGEAARGARGDDALLVVCPADWTSKRHLLRAAGYNPAIKWFIKTIVDRRGTVK